MNSLIIMVGLPRSGKSTLARVLEYPTVSCDAVRQALGVYPFIPAAEKMVHAMTRYMVEALFNAGHKTVILDSTGLTRKIRAEWKSSKWARTYILLDTSKEECIARALGTNQEYLIPIIERMALQYEPVEDDEIDNPITRTSKIDVSGTV